MTMKIKPDSLQFYGLILLTFFVISCGTSNAYKKTKNPNITWMDNKQAKRTEMPTNYCFEENGKLYGYGYGGGKSFYINGIGGTSRIYPIFYEVDKEKMTISKSSKKAKKDKVESIDKVAWLKSAGWILFTEDAKKKQKSMMARPISFEDTKAKDKELFEIEVERRKDFVQDGYGFNSDSTTITYFAEIYEGKNDRLVFKQKCFDFVTMAKLWEKSYTFPHTVKKRKDIDDIDWMINKNGEAEFILKRYNEGRREAKKGSGGKESNYNFYFYVLNKQGKVEEYPLNLHGSFVEKVDFPFNKTKNPVVCGYTFTSKNFKELKGLNFYEINLDTKETELIKQVDFNIKKLTAVDEETGKKIKQGGTQFERVANLEMQKVIITDDNSVYCLGENNYYYERCTRNSKTGTETCIKYVKSGNILVSKLTDDGESWSIIIPKSQDLPVVFNAASFAAFELNNKIHLIFNDNYKNYKEAKVTKIKPWLGKNTSIIHVIVNPDGTYEMIEALGRKDHPRFANIGTISLIDDQSVILFDTKTLGRLKLDK